MYTHTAGAAIEAEIAAARHPLRKGRHLQVLYFNLILSPVSFLSLLLRKGRESLVHLEAPGLLSKISLGSVLVSHAWVKV